MKSVLYGEVEVPENEALIMREILKYKGFFEHCQTHSAQRYFQSVIDCLEDALDQFRREENV